MSHQLDHVQSVVTAIVREILRIPDTTELHNDVNLTEHGLGVSAQTRVASTLEQRLQLPSTAVSRLLPFDDEPMSLSSLLAIVTDACRRENALSA